MPGPALQRTTSMNARWHVVTALTLALVGAMPLSAIAHDFKAGSLELKHPWSAKAPSVAPVMGGYITIINHGPDADRLVGGTSAVAEKVELHQSTLVDGVARMRPASPGIDIPAGGTVSLQPGGTHILCSSIPWRGLLKARPSRRRCSSKRPVRSRSNSWCRNPNERAVMGAMRLPDA